MLRSSRDKDSDKNYQHFAWVNGGNARFSEDIFDLAEDRLSRKKKQIEDLQHEYNLLENDAFLSYKTEAFYFIAAIETINAAFKWLEMQKTADKRKKCYEKECFNNIVKDVKFLIGDYDIKLTGISFYGYNRSAVSYKFELNGKEYGIKIPIVPNISMQDYQDGGPYVFKVQMYVITHNGSCWEGIYSTYNEDTIKDFFKKYLEENKE